jgi:hypothetical protein
LFRDPALQQFLQVNRYRDVLWFNQEAFERLLWTMLAKTAVSLNSARQSAAKQPAQTIDATYALIQELQAAAETSGYQVEGLLAATRRKTTAV